MKNHFYTPVNWFKSLRIAFKGLKMIIRNERNFRIQMLAGALVVVVGLVMGFDHSEWIAAAFFITLVLISEAFNSVIEAICDCISMEYRDTIRYAKDVSAGAVLLSSIASLIGGTLIIYPHVVVFVSRLFIK
jgi:diacylglycerol kinase